MLLKVQNGKSAGEGLPGRGVLSGRHLLAATLRAKGNRNGGDASALD